jgi:hypothetical protein
VDAGIITAIVAGLSAAGAGAWKLIDRADKKRERREVAVEELLKAQYAKAEAELARVKRYCSQIKSAAGKWREQLIANDIDPVPAEWPEDTHE